MVVYGRLMLFIFLYVSLLMSPQACKKSRSDPKFVALNQSKRKDYGWFKTRHFLIHNVHSGIKIGISIQGNCLTTDAATQFTAQSLSAWIHALQSAHDQRRVVLKKSLITTLDIVTRSRSTNDLVVKFICKKGRSATTIPGISGGPITIELLRDQRAGQPAGTEFINNRYSHTLAFIKRDLVHELGHAMGLADLYLYMSGRDSSYTTTSANVSTGGASNVVGSQPSASIMAGTATQHIQEDDIAGLIWLYRYFVREDLPSKSTCVAGYQYEQATGGCLPIQGRSERSFRNH